MKKVVSVVLMMLLLSGLVFAKESFAIKIGEVVKEVENVEKIEEFKSANPGKLSSKEEYWFYGPKVHMVKENYISIGFDYEIVYINSVEEEE